MILPICLALVIVATSLTSTQERETRPTEHPLLSLLSVMFYHCWTVEESRDEHLMMKMCAL